MGTLLYSVILYTQYKVCQKFSKCQRDPDSPSLSPSARSWPISSEPRRTRSSQDPRSSNVSGLISRRRSFRTLRTNNFSYLMLRCSPSSARRSTSKHTLPTRQTFSMFDNCPDLTGTGWNSAQYKCHFLTSINNFDDK